MLSLLFAVLGLSGSGQAPVPPPPGWSATLDCARPVYAAEMQICEDPELLGSARRMEMAYAQRAGTLSEPRALSLAADQEAWSKKRNHCAFSADAKACIGRLQKNRIQTLQRR